MDRAVVTELHYMTPIDNLASIVEHGLLSHAHAAAVPHRSVAMVEVQDRRAGTVVPGGRPLHEYVNLYFDARNAMMFSRRSDSLVVVRVDPAVIELPGAVVSDGNAASNQTRFYAPGPGLAALDETRVYARSWKSDDLWDEWERKRQRQAEVLVPDMVPPAYIMGCYARRDPAATECRRRVADLVVEVNAYVYFD